MPKCAICKKNLIKSEAYVVETKDEETGEVKKRTYYCSEEKYREMIKERENKDAVYEEIRKKYFPSIQMVKSLPRIIFIDIGGISNTHTWGQILEYLHDDEEYLNGIMDKDFVSYNARVKYFVKVVLNRIDGKRTRVRKQSEVKDPIVKQSEEIFIAPSYTPKKQVEARRGFDDLLGDL